MRLSYLYGARTGTWLRLLSRHGLALGPRPLARAGLVTLMALLNSGIRRLQSPVDPPSAPVRRPIFILGHWRSGTTHLQYLMARDGRFASPTTYEVCFPNSLGAERWHGRLLAPLMPAKRLQDGMEFGLHVPNEDEIALAALGLPSPYHLWGFPNDEAVHTRHMSFRGASPAERHRFEAGLDAYLRALAAKHGRTLLIKSPTHTARIRLLRGLYPDARFVHIHRHPYRVFQSTRHLHRTWYRRSALLHELDMSRLDERILAAYRHMYEVFFDEMGDIPEGHFHEMRFDDLERDPIGELRQLYETFDLRPFPKASLRGYMANLSGYRKNTYPPLVCDEQRRVYTAWRMTFDAWGYRP